MGWRSLGGFEVGLVPLVDAQSSLESTRGHGSKVQEGTRRWVKESNFGTPGGVKLQNLLHNA